MFAILFSQNRQYKAAEKERIQRQHEDELNRAIAIRKVELEGLVAERTAELTNQKEELEHALEELRSTQSQLIQSEKMASLGELTAGIAHEIQNPLNFVNNFSEVSNELLEEMETEMDKGNGTEVKQIIADLKINLEKINHHGKRADSIVKGMLLHSRASTGQKEPTNINNLADEYLRLAYHGLRAKDKSFNSKMITDFDKTLGKINIVPQDIGRVILNLLNNSFYAVTEKRNASDLQGFENLEGLGAYEPTVWLSTKNLGNEVEIKVADNGNGIPQQIVDKIFQPFFTTKPTGHGTGLGLSLCYEIVTKGHEGDLHVESTEGEGSVFTIHLPLNN
jgi:signal transduction histidine kinase